MFLRRGHQDQVSKHLGDLECYVCEVDLWILQVALQEVMNLAVNAVGHLNSLYLPAFSPPRGAASRPLVLRGVERMHHFDIPRVKREIENAKLLSS